MSLLISLLKLRANSQPVVFMFPEFVCAAACPKEPGRVIPGANIPLVLRSYQSKDAPSILKILTSIPTSFVYTFSQVRFGSTFVGKPIEGGAMTPLFIHQGFAEFNTDKKALFP